MTPNPAVERTCANAENPDTHQSTTGTTQLQIAPTNWRAELLLLMVCHAAMLSA